MARYDLNYKRLFRLPDVRKDVGISLENKIEIFQSKKSEVIFSFSQHLYWIYWSAISPKRIDGDHFGFKYGNRDLRIFLIFSVQIYQKLLGTLVYQMSVREFVIV